MQAKRFASPVVILFLLASLLMVSCSFGYPKDMDLVLSSHYDNGIISRTYSNVALYPDHVQKLPANDIADVYVKYPEFKRLSEVGDDIKTAVDYDVIFDDNDMALEVNTERLQDPEVHADDEVIIQDALRRVEDGIITPHDTDVKWVKHGNTLEARIIWYGNYALINIDDAELSSNGFVQCYVDGAVYYDGQFIGEIESYGIDDYDSFVKTDYVSLFS